MTSYIERDAKADDGREITVEIAVESYGHPGNGFDAPPESPELYLTRAWDRQTGDPVAVTQAEAERIEQETVDEPDFGEYHEPEPGLWEE
jgi:hypothetical protein